MKGAWVLMVGILTALILLIFMSEKKEQENLHTFENGTLLSQIRIGNMNIQPEDFFPYEEGKRWVYEIEIQKEYPMYARSEEWNLRPGDPRIFYSVRGYFPNAMDAKGKKFRLILDVEKIIEANIADAPVDIVHINVERDDLGMFDHATHLAWIVPRFYTNTFSVREIVECNSNSFSAPAGARSKMYGQSDRLIFLVPDTSFPSQVYEGEPMDVLSCIGLEHSSPGRVGSALHMRRVIPYDKSMGKEKYAYEFFEDAWYMRGIGLVYFSQTIGDSTSLVGRLVEW